MRGVRQSKTGPDTFTLSTSLWLMRSAGGSATLKAVSNRVQTSVSGLSHPQVVSHIGTGSPSQKQEVQPDQCQYQLQTLDKVAGQTPVFVRNKITEGAVINTKQETLPQTYQPHFPQICR